MSSLVLKVSSRRASLVTIMTAGLAAFAPSFAVAMNKHRKNKGKRADPDKLCKKQADEWTAVVTAACEDSADCHAELACATPLKSCDFDGFLVCFTGGQAMSRFPVNREDVMQTVTIDTLLCP